MIDARLAQAAFVLSRAIDIINATVERKELDSKQLMGFYRELDKFIKISGVSSEIEKGKTPSTICWSLGGGSYD